MQKKITLALAAALVALGSATFAADAPPDPSEAARQARMNAALQDERNGKPSADESLGTRMKRDASEAGHAVGNGARRAGHAIGHAASATGHAIGHAATATGHAIRNGVHRTGTALHNATIVSVSAHPSHAAASVPASSLPNTGTGHCAASTRPSFLSAARAAVPPAIHRASPAAVPPRVRLDIRRNIRQAVRQPVREPARWASCWPRPRSPARQAPPSPRRT